MFVDGSGARGRRLSFRDFCPALFGPTFVEDLVVTGLTAGELVPVLGVALARIATSAAVSIFSGMGVVGIGSARVSSTGAFPAVVPTWFSPLERG